MSPEVSDSSFEYEKSLVRNTSPQMVPTRYEFKLTALQCEYRHRMKNKKKSITISTFALMCVRKKITHTYIKNENNF